MATAKASARSGKARTSNGKKSPVTTKVDPSIVKKGAQAKQAPKKEEPAITFEPTTPSDSKKAIHVSKIVTAYVEAKGQPLIFADVCAKAGAKYSQDVEAAMFALEHLGKVERLKVKGNGSSGRVAYQWVS